jgi:hypothetical protein
MEGYEARFSVVDYPKRGMQKNNKKQAQAPLIS